MTNALVRAEVQSRSWSPFESWVWTSAQAPGVNGSVDDLDAIDCDLAELVVQLCTRIGMIEEDMVPLALGASSDLEERVAAVAQAVRKMALIADAAEGLLAR